MPVTSLNSGTSGSCSFKDISRPLTKADTARLNQGRLFYGHKSTDGRCSIIVKGASGGVFGVTAITGHAPLLIPQRHVLNGLNRQSLTDSQLDGLSKAPADSFHIVYNTGFLHLWPAMRAAAAPREYHKIISDQRNPFAGKTVEECLAYFKNAIEKDGSPRWKEQSKETIDNPKWQGRVFHDNRTGRTAVVDSGGEYKSGTEPPHIDMVYGANGTKLLKVPQAKLAPDGTPTGEIRMVVRAKLKLPLDPSRPEWTSYRKSNAARYEAHERAKGRDPSARPIVPSMQKGGVEFSLAPIDDLELPPDLHVLHRLESDSLLYGPEEVHEIIRALFLGIYVWNEIPSLAMDPAEDTSVDVSMHPVYKQTLVGEVLANIDAYGKGIMLGMVISPEGRLHLGQHWRDIFGVKDDDDARNKMTSANYDDVLAVYKRFGGRSVLNEESAEAAELRKANQALEEVRAEGGIEAINYTFVPNVEAVDQGQNGAFVVPRVVLHVGGYIAYTAEYEDNDDYKERAGQAHARHADAIKSFMLKLPEVQRDIELLKVIGFYVHFLLTLQQKNLIPDLNKLPAPFIVHEDEDKMPPFLKPKGTGDASWYLHGEARVDLAHVPVQDLSLASEQLIKACTPAWKKGKQKLMATEGPQNVVVLPISLGRIDKKNQVPEWLFQLRGYQDVEKCIASIRADPQKYPDRTYYENLLDVWLTERGRIYDGDFASLDPRARPDVIIALFRGNNYDLVCENHTINIFRARGYVGDVEDPYGRSALSYLLDRPDNLRSIVEVVRSLKGGHEAEKKVQSAVRTYLTEFFQEKGIKSALSHYFAKAFWQQAFKYDSPNSYKGRVNLFRLAAAYDLPEMISCIYKAFFVSRKTMPEILSVGNQPVLCTLLSGLAKNGTKKEFLRELYAHLLFKEQVTKSYVCSLYLEKDLKALNSCETDPEKSHSGLLLQGRVYAYKVLQQHDFSCGMDLVLATAFSLGHSSICWQLVKLPIFFSAEPGEWPTYRVQPGKLNAVGLLQKYYYENYEYNARLVIYIMRAMHWCFDDLQDQGMKFAKKVIGGWDTTALRMLLSLGLNKDECDVALRPVNAIVRVIGNSTRISPSKDELERLESLHAAGFSFDSRDADGYYPLDYVRNNEHVLVRKLKKFGAVHRTKWFWQSVPPVRSGASY